MTTPAASTQTPASTDTSLTAPAGGDQSTVKPEGGDAAKSSTEQTADAGTEKKPAGEAEKTEPEARVAPEKYEFVAPEGTTLDSEVLGKFEGLARELKMPQAEAQRVVETMLPVFQAQAARQVEQAGIQWRAEAKADKEIGGDKLDENLGLAKRVLTQFGSAAFNDLLEKSKLGEHPEMIRLLVKAGRAISPDKVETGRTAATTDNSNDAKARRMYPTMKQ
jgi:hypothetical protein